MDTLLCTLSLWISLKGNQVSFSVNDSSRATTATFRAWTTFFSTHLFHKSCIYFWLPWVNPSNRCAVYGWPSCLPCQVTAISNPPQDVLLRLGSLCGCRGPWRKGECCITHAASMHSQQEEMILNSIVRLLCTGIKLSNVLQFREDNSTDNCGDFK